MHAHVLTYIVYYHTTLHAVDVTLLLLLLYVFVRAQTSRRYQFLVYKTCEREIQRTENSMLEVFEKFIR